jgi:hypothetical protein
MPEVKKHKIETLDIQIDEDHSLHAIINDGELSIVTISSKEDPEGIEDFCFKELQPLADAIGIMTNELRLRGVPRSKQ